VLVRPSGSCEAGPVRLTPRALWLAWCLAGFGCLGGPTSDWPDKANEDGDPTAPKPSEPEDEADGDPGNALDAGSRPTTGLDAGSPVGAGSCPGDGAVDLGPSDAGVPDGSTRVGPSSHNGDGGCR